VLAALVAIALVAAVVAELAAELVAAPLDLDVLASWWPRWWSPIAAMTMQVGGRRGGGARPRRVHAASS
jgi:hypothetical protein